MVISVLVKRREKLPDDRSYNYTHTKMCVTTVTLVKKGCMVTPESEPLNEVTLQYLVNF